MNISRYNLTVLIIVGLIFMQACSTPKTENKPAEFDCRGKSVVGVKLEDIASQKGVQVTKVWQGSPADRAGIKEGDIIISVGGVETGNREKLVSVAQKSPADVPTEYKIIRNSKNISLPVVPEAACKVFKKKET